MEKVEINKQARLSEHFTLGEMCKTSAKKADGRSAQGDALLAKNIPSHVHIENLKRLCGWLEMLRDEWNRRYGEGDDPIVINSGYRSEAVNKAVGGVKGSNHLTGCAADIRVAGMEQALRYAVILLDISDESGGLRRTPIGAFAQGQLLAPLRRPSTIAGESQEDTFHSNVKSPLIFYCRCTP